MKQFAADVAKSTDGKVQIDVYSSATLGSEDKMLIAVQSGTQDLYMGALSPIAARKKALQIFDFRFCLPAMPRPPMCSMARGPPDARWHCRYEDARPGLGGRRLPQYVQQQAPASLAGRHEGPAVRCAVMQSRWRWPASMRWA
ncbi:hypothetical protein [Comamonas sp. JC664]|uniref:hypothetical protein n=1 Tax=Comamonas sp. JC664 TaxID=2801917 RepID=UPI00360EBEB0